MSENDGLLDGGFGAAVVNGNIYIIVDDSQGSNYLVRVTPAGVYTRMERIQAPTSPISALSDAGAVFASGGKLYVIGNSLVRNVFTRNQMWEVNLNNPKHTQPVSYTHLTLPTTPYV